VNFIGKMGLINLVSVGVIENRTNNPKICSIVFTYDFLVIMEFGNERLQ
jgi:hypothetical protein